MSRPGDKSAAPAAGELFLALGLVWLIPFLLVAPLWEKARYYDYAVLVFPLAAFLLWSRRDALRPTNWKRINLLDTLLLGAAAGALALVAWLGAGTYAWRALNGLAAALAVGMTAWLAFRTGGLRRAYALAGIVAFVLTAFPWPLPWENPVVDGFTARVIGFNVFLLPLLGIPAEAAGNQLVVAGHIVTVADACSGIKSLQMLLAASLFIGEYAGLRPWARGLLVAAVWPLAFVFNVIRATVLAYGTFTQGEPWYDQWHEPSGYLSFLCSGASLLALAAWLPSAPVGPAVTPGANATSPPRLISWLRWLPSGLLAVAAVYLGFHRIAWSGETTRGKTIATLNLPAAWGPEILEVPENADKMLFCEDIQRLSFSLGGGREVEIYAMIWDDLVAGYTDVSLHRPDACMVRYGGGTLLAGPLVRTLPGGLESQFYRIAYPSDHRTLLVYRVIGRITDRRWQREGWAEEIARGYQYSRKYDLARLARSRGERLFMLFVGIDESVSLKAADGLATEVFEATLDALERSDLVDLPR